MSKEYDLEIYPVKQIKDNGNKITVPEPLLKPPFLLILIAPVKSGKSVLIANLLYRFYRGVFDEILFFSSTVMNDKTYESNVKIDDDIIKFHSDLERTEAMLEAYHKLRMEENDNKRVLIVLDDMLGFLKKGFGNLCTRYRQPNISIMVTTQNFRGLPRSCRYNAMGYIFFKSHNKKEKEAINEELADVFPEGVFEKAYNEATNKKYNFLYCNLQDGKELYHNFTDQLYKD